MMPPASKSAKDIGRDCTPACPCGLEWASLLLLLFRTTRRSARAGVWCGMSTRGKGKGKGGGPSPGDDPRGRQPIRTIARHDAAECLRADLEQPKMPHTSISSHCGPLVWCFPPQQRSTCRKEQWWSVLACTQGRKHWTGETARRCEIRELRDEGM